MRLALVYDRVNKIGGAERILTALHQIWPQAPLYTAVYQAQSAPWADGWPIRTSFLQNFSFARTHHEWFFWAMPLAFESFNFQDYDVVISVTSAEAKGILTQPKTLHLCYCLTPTRYLYSHTHDYLEPLGWLKPLVASQLSCLRRWDQIASTRPDHYLAISQTVQSRISKYYHRSAQIIYPPVDIDKFTSPRPFAAQFNLEPNRFFLLVSRLVPYKKIDLAINACNQLKLPLVIVGTGSQAAYLQALAGPTIYFTGQLTDQELVSYYQNCRALIFTAEEDFGLTVLEAQAAGKPVLAYQSGGAQETIIAGQTGEFFKTQSTKSLILALKKFSHQQYSTLLCQKNARRFSLAKFKLKINRTVEDLWQNHRQLQN